MKFYIALLLFFSCHMPFIFASRAMPPIPSSSPKYRTVNLGGWLVTEGWIKPSLFDGIPNKDLLDGTQLQFKSVTQNKYLCAESGGGTIIVANRTSASGWETFKLWRVTEDTFQFRVFGNQFVGLNNQGEAVAVTNSPDQSETFEIFRYTNDLNRIRIKAPNGFFLQAKTDVLVTADYQENTTWGDDDPSVFLITSLGGLQGEFQVTNGYGTEKAPPIMREHWNTFIVEEDFKFISQNGLNGVRIPVGWWIASDPTPWPFVGGSLHALDNAFLWAEKYGLGVIVDLHAAPGSQNGNEHSASRDGSQDWGKTDENIDQTVAVIDFLAKRYAKSSSLLAIELINEPTAPGVTLDSLMKYYQAGYNTVRKYSSDAYVIMSNRLSASSTELLQFASGLKGSVIDVHYYNLFWNGFDGMTAQQNIDFVNTNRSSDLNTVTISNGPPVFVGEWVAEWQVRDASKEDYQRLAQAMLDAFGRATFGWSYWTLKHVQNHWSLEWMITNGYIKMPPIPSFSTPSPKFRTVNLGGWLVTEGWIKPSLFDGIPNKDLLDGTQLQFKSVTQNKYLCAESGGGTIIVANRTSASGWETFKLWRVTEDTFQFRVFGNQFVGLNNQGEAVAVTNSPGQLETFEILRYTNDLNRIRIKAPNGFFLQAKTDVLVTADYQENTTWGDDDPSVFLITSPGRLQGEFQVTNGYGTEKAPPIMRDHWNTFIVEEDFKFISQNGLNGVRIPVGWWIASDPTPPWPFVGGSLNALDNAFLWAEKYGLGVIVDLHAAPGSQNGDEHSASRDGSQDWGKTDEIIDQTVEVIDFLAKRYAKSSSLLAIELINEPRAPGVTLDSLMKYYQAGYNTVRKYSSDAYVIMSNRLSPANITELLPFASGLKGSVIDVHYYNLFQSRFDGMTVEQNIDYVKYDRSAELNTMTRANGPPVFVGEWVAEWKVSNASKEDYQKLAQEMLDVFGRATFGWSYWTLKNVRNHWSLEWMITNGYIKIMS